MIPDRHVKDQLPAYALDALSNAEMLEVAQHLKSCVICRAELQAYLNVVEQLGMAVTEAEPPPFLKTQLMAKIRHDKTIPAGSHSSSFTSKLAKLFRTTAPGLGFASLLLAVILLAASFLFWQRTNILGLDDTLPVVALVNTDQAPEARAILVMSRDSKKGTLVVDGLPDLGEEQQYQLWLIKDGDRTSGGVFSVSQDGYGYLRVASPGALLDFDRFGVTIEPPGGSPGPTGPQVLFSEPK